LQVGEPLTVLGTGSGLPIKIDSAARVIDVRAAEADFFSVESDTFEGSSGSGVFDADNQLLGVLVRGGTDYLEDKQRGCLAVNRREQAVVGEADGDLGHEEATYVSHAVKRLCDQGFPSQAICAIDVRCGDGICSGSESRADCAIDCDPCDAGVCRARADVRFSAGSAVKQIRRPRADSSGGCALGAGPLRARTTSAALLMLAVWLRARRLSRRFP
jgi:hypothetical protein